jgi:hypothetical protein
MDKNQNKDTEYLNSEIDETAVDNDRVLDNSADDAGDDEEEMTPEAFKKYKELAHNYKVRAEKAEARSKSDNRQDGDGRKSVQRKGDAAEFSQADMFALMRANITEDDDIAQISKYSRGLGITVQEALKDETLQTILQKRAEMRETARATQTGNRRAGNQRTSDAKLVEDAERGIFPENEADIERLARARVMAKRLKK